MGKGNPLFRFLDTNGDGTGTKDMSVNGSVTPVVYKFAPANHVEVHRSLINYQDTAGWSADNFADLAAPLTNGIEVEVLVDDVVYDLLDGVPIQANGHWARFCYDGRLDNFGVGEDLFAVRWTFARSGQPLILGPGDELRVTINDDLSLVTAMYWQIQGVVVG